MSEFQVEDIPDLEHSSSVLDLKTALPVKEGYITKRGETVKSWKRRWFQLRGGQLYYYKERGDVLLGTISLNDSDVGHMDYLNKQNCFAIKTTKRIFYCVADTTTEATEWLDCIVKHGVNARLIPEGIRVTQSTRAVKMGKKGIEVTTSPIGRIKTTLRSSTLKDPVMLANTPHTFHRKFVNGLVRCSQCKGQLKKQCYLCQVCRCCIHPRCFKDTPPNCYSRDDFNLEERPVSPRLALPLSEMPRLHDPRADRAKNPGRRLPERISQRVRESGVYRRDEYSIQAPPADVDEDYQFTNGDFGARTVTEPPKIFGAVKVGIVFNPADLNRRLAATGNTINHRGSITTGDAPIPSPRREVEAAPVVPRGPPAPARSKKPAPPGMRPTKSVPESYPAIDSSAFGEYQDATPAIPIHSSADLTDHSQVPASPVRRATQLNFLDQFDFINTPLSIEEEENPEGVVPTTLRRESASTSPRTQRAPPPAKKAPKVAPPPKKPAKKQPPTLNKTTPAPEPLEEHIVVIEPEPISEPVLPIIESELSASSSRSSSTEGSSPNLMPGRPKGRVSNTKIVIPDFPVEYMTRELPPLDPNRRTISTEKRSEAAPTIEATPEPYESPRYGVIEPDPMPLESSSEEESSEGDPYAYVQPTPIEVAVPPVAVSPKNSPKIPAAKKGMRPKGSGEVVQPSTPPTPVVVPPGPTVTKQPQVAPESVEVRPVVGSPKLNRPTAAAKGKGPGPKVGAPPGLKQPPTLPAVKQSVVEQQPKLEEVSPPSSPQVPVAVAPKQTMIGSGIKKPAPPGAKRGLVSSGQNPVPGLKKSGEIRVVPRSQFVNEPERAVVPKVPEAAEPVVIKPVVAAKPQLKRALSEKAAPPSLKKSGPKIPPAKKPMRPKEPVATKPVEKAFEAPKPVSRSDEFDGLASQVEQPTEVPVIEIPATIDDIDINSDNKPAVRAVRKASMTNRSLDFPLTKQEKAVTVSEPVYDDWGADIGEIQEATDLIDDDFEDAFTDFDNFDDVMATLRNDTSELDVLIKDSKYGAWDLDDSSTTRSVAPKSNQSAPNNNNNTTVDDNQAAEYEYYDEEQPASTVTEDYGDYEAW